MPAKFEARIRQPHTEAITAYVEAYDEHDAKILLEQQYGRDNVSFVKKISQSSAEEHSSHDGQGDDPITLAAGLVLCIAGWLAYQGYTAFIKPLFSREDKVPVAATIQAENSTPTYDVSASASNVSASPGESQDSNPVDTQIAGPSPEIITDQNNQTVTSTVSVTPPAKPQLIKFHVTVRNGESHETISISAKDEDDARRIVRDFRGNPEILELKYDVSSGER
jgi:hypothetical protein